MAEAEGQLMVAEREWLRVKSLGRKVVSDKRYTEARVTRDQAKARVRAYGMSDEQIDSLLDTKNNIAADGTFSLVATLAGRVLHDDRRPAAAHEPASAQAHTFVFFIGRYVINLIAGFDFFNNTCKLFAGYRCDKIDAIGDKVINDFCAN